MRILIAVIGLAVIASLVLGLHLALTHGSCLIHGIATPVNNQALNSVVNVSNPSGSTLINPNDQAPPSIVPYNMTGLRCAEVVIQSPRGGPRGRWPTVRTHKPILQSCPPPGWRPGMPPIYCPETQP